MKILVVDDDPNLRGLVGLALERAGFTVVTAADGQVALMQAAREAPDLIILDQGLPESQAWWTVKRQAMTADTQATPALYLGTTSGELWIGHDEGARWLNIARHLPEIYAVEVAALG